MSDEPIAPEPGRTLPLRTSLLIGGAAFLGGIALTAGVARLAGPAQTPVAPIAAPAPDPAPAAQPQANRAPALPPGTDIATLSAREQELAARLDRLDLRLRDVDSSARTASLQANQAERLLIAAAARRALERRQPLGLLAVQLRQRFGRSNGEAVAAILRAAADPVTLEDLRLALDTIAPRLSSSPDEDLWTKLRRSVGDLVVIRQAASPSPRIGDRLRRARRALDQGDVETALAEVAHLPGAAQAESWIAAARRYVAARQGLLAIEAAALQAPPATPPPPAAVPLPAGT